MKLAIANLVFALSLSLSITPARAQAATPAPVPVPVPVRVRVPDADNLQYLSFWVAQGASFFAEEGVQTTLVIPAAAALAQSAFQNGDTEVAVLSPPMYLRLVAERFPFVLLANLLQNDPIDLLVRRSVAEARGLSRAQPLEERLRGLHGLRVGVAPGPPSRLRALMNGSGLDADRDLELVILHGRDQNAAFGERRVDALYAHTPFLEKALLDQDAVVLVDQAGGEFAPLASRQIHALVATRAFAAAHHDVVAAMVRAIYRAQRLVHGDPARATDAVMRAVSSYDRRHVEALVALYAAAIPATPRVTADGFAPALALYPASGDAPSLAGIDLRTFVAPELADAAVDAIGPPKGASGARRQPRVLAGVIALGLLVALLAVLRDHGYPRRRMDTSV
jgi:ABC-type nitrate/sulfonate/bicarbonate transport system substrate-binding protein